MSGHSKWSKIQHKKGKNDKARSATFTKLLKAITVAAGQGGGDLDMNFALRLAVQKAKSANMPKDNIENAIKRGTGEGKDAASFEEALYEGFGPDGVALLIECLTDNKNRTVSDVKLILSKNGGSAAGPGSVQWQFEHKGAIRFSSEKKAAIADWDDMQLALMDAGAGDIKEESDHVEILCEKESLKQVIDVCTTNNLEPDDSGLEWLPKDPVVISEGTAAKLEKILDAFEESDDVKEVYTNVA